MKIQVKAEIETPKVPNFLRRTDGEMMPLNAIDKKDLKLISEAWLVDLTKNWERMNQNAKALK